MLEEILCLLFHFIFKISIQIRHYYYRMEMKDEDKSCPQSYSLCSGAGIGYHLSTTHSFLLVCGLWDHQRLPFVMHHNQISESLVPETYCFQHSSLVNHYLLITFLFCFQHLKEKELLSKN